ncbi:unnamed protein product, partial [Polarella glacialis]
RESCDGSRESRAIRGKESCDRGSGAFCATGDSYRCCPGARCTVHPARRFRCCTGREGRRKGWTPLDFEAMGAVEEELNALTVVQLKDKLRELALPVSGTKAELVERLVTKDASGVGEGETVAAEEGQGEAAAPMEETKEEAAPEASQEEKLEEKQEEKEEEKQEEVQEEEQTAMETADAE